ncbi:MAG: dihydrofolate reductase [Leptolyngbya sp. SIO4C1]|nr:dihydrofolate reductase [Leptolyngbya sp. SIO4C1]
MKITYYVAASLDGFIARADGDVSWLDEMDLGEDETDLEEFFSTVDGLIMGRNTYDFIFNYGSWPYENKPTWVCTSRDLQPLEGANLIVVGNIDDVISGAASRGCGHLWLVGGGQLASAFMAKGLITNVSISEMPIELGAGIPLFSDHRLEDIASEKRNVIEKKGFRQIEIILENNGDITAG